MARFKPGDMVKMARPPRQGGVWDFNDNLIGLPVVWEIMSCTERSAQLRPHHVEGVHHDVVQSLGVSHFILRKPVAGIRRFSYSPYRVWAYVDMLDPVGSQLKEGDEVYRIIYSNGYKYEIGVSRDALSKMSVKDLFDQLFSDPKIKINFEKGVADAPAEGFSIQAHPDDGVAVLRVGPYAPDQSPL